MMKIEDIGTKQSFEDAFELFKPHIYLLNFFQITIDNNTFREAKTDDDFEIIIQRELSKKQNNDESENGFLHWIKEVLVEKIKIYKENYRIASERDHYIIDKTDRFIGWLDKRDGKINKSIINDKPEPGQKDLIVFNDLILSNFHASFNETSELWNKISLLDFIRSFKGLSKIEIVEGKQKDFCYALGLLEKYRNEKACPNMEVWVKNIFGITSYKSQKKSNPKTEFTRIKRTAIKTKINSFLAKSDN